MAREAMGKSASDNLSKGVGCSDVRIVFEHVVKHSQRKVRFEWKKMKGRASDAKGWSMKNFAAGIVSKKGQYVVCGKAKRNSDKHVKLVKRVSDEYDKVKQMKVFIDNEVKENCDHAMV